MKRSAVNHDEGTASQTSSSLLQAARDNDPAAWRRVVDTYSRRIYRWCRRAGLQPEDASDVVQEVFRAVARKLADFHHDQLGDSFRGWLYRITQNKVRDHQNRRSGRRETAWGGTDAHRRLMDVEDPPSDSDISDAKHTSSNHIDAEVLRQVQAEFSNRDWLVFWRVAVDGQTSAEAGKQFQMTSNAVRLVKMRVLRRFRELMGGASDP